MALPYPDYAFLWAWEPVDPGRLASVLDGFQAPWWVAGGVALDLATGTSTRAHADLDVAILRRDQAQLRTHLGGWELFWATPDHALEPWRGEPLEPPIPAVWARPRPDAPWLCEFLLNECDGDLWRFGPEPRITRPLEEIGTTSAEGIPILVPELVLLFKAGEPSPKNDADFRAALPHLSDDGRSWLRAAIATCHADHPWLPHLAG